MVTNCCGAGYLEHGETYTCIACGEPCELEEDTV